MSPPPGPVAFLTLHSGLTQSLTQMYEKCTPILYDHIHIILSSVGLIAVTFRQTDPTQYTYCLREGPGSYLWLIIPVRDNESRRSMV